MQCELITPRRSNMSTITIEIKGRPWTFILMPDKRFDKLHNPEGDLATGMTMPNTYEVHFRKSDWCNVDIRHELGHVLFRMSEANAAELSPADVEEVMCEIYAKNYADIGVWSDRIAEKFFGRE